MFRILGCHPTFEGIFAAPYGRYLEHVKNGYLECTFTCTIETTVWIDVMFNVIFWIAQQCTENEESQSLWHFIARGIGCKPVFYDILALNPCHCKHLKVVILEDILGDMNCPFTTILWTSITICFRMFWTTLGQFQRGTCAIRVISNIQRGYSLNRRKTRCALRRWTWDVWVCVQNERHATKQHEFLWQGPQGGGRDDVLLVVHIGKNKCTWLVTIPPPRSVMERLFISQMINALCDMFLSET